MIRLSIQVETTIRGSALRESVRDGLEAAAVHWHDKILSKHFTVAGSFEYQYARRTYAYSERKERTKGHRRPLVFKGDLERQLSRQREVTADTSTRGSPSVKIRLSGPKYFHMKPSPRQPDLAAEVSRVSERDERELARIIDKRAEEALNKPGRPRPVAQE